MRVIYLPGLERHQKGAESREEPPVAPLQAGGQQGLQRGRRAPLGGSELHGELGPDSIEKF